MTERPVYLPDVNLLLAFLDQRHVHHDIAEAWFDSPGLHWALCALTEAGVLRFFTRPNIGDLNMQQVTAMLNDLRQQPGYCFQSIDADWHTLTSPFSRRLHGHNQVTDAYLLGLAIHHDLVLTTFDRALTHLAGEHSRHLLVLKS